MLTELARHRKTNTEGSHLRVESEVKLMEAESRRVVVRDWGGINGEMFVGAHGLSVIRGVKSWGSKVQRGDDRSHSCVICLKFAERGDFKQ